MFKQFFPSYFKLFTNDVKYLFVEYGGDAMQDDFLETDTYLYIKGQERFDKILEKTCIASRYIASHYSFDFLIRSNLSSLWNIPNLLRLHSKISLTKFFGGFLACNEFISGTGIIVSNDILWVLDTYKQFQGPTADDVFITRLFSQHGFPLFDVSQIQGHVMCYQITNHLCCDTNSTEHSSNNSTDKITRDPDSILYVRIKNTTLELDLTCCKVAVNTFYAINL
jgi:hypothetical protein